MKLSFQLLCPVIAALLTGCSGITVNVYNDTPETVYDVNITWDANRQTFDEIQPGERVKFDIPTNLEGMKKEWGVSADMTYVWQGEKYEYPDMIRSISAGDNFAIALRIAGTTARSDRRLLVGGTYLRTGIIRKTPEEEREILEAAKARWRTADRIEVQEHWREVVPKKGDSQPDWEYVSRESITAVLSETARETMVDLLATLTIPGRSTLDDGVSQSFDIKIYRGNELLDHLKYTRSGNIIHPGINTALHFPSRQQSTQCQRLLLKAVPKRR